jgi:lysophospholipase L1-like esterase
MRFMEWMIPRRRLLLLGDSIAEGYAPALQGALNGIKVVRPPQKSSTSARVAEGIERWISQIKPAGVVFNCGLHDLQIFEGKTACPLPQYAENLETIAAALQGRAAMFVTTTPIPEGAENRKSGAEISYNDALRMVARSHSIPVCDLWGFAKRHPELQLPNDVHYTDEGYRQLGQYIAEHVARLDVPAVQNRGISTPPPKWTSTSM